MNRRYNFDIEVLRDLCSTKESVSEILIHLNIGPTNNYARKILKKFCQENLITLPVYDQSNSGHNFSKKRTLEELLVLHIDTKAPQSAKLSQRLRAENHFEYVCQVCFLNPEWNGLPLVLHLDHINGNPADCRVENLRFLCPNCHSQTDTYAGKNMNKQRFISSVG